MNIGVLGCTGKVGNAVVKELLHGQWDRRGLQFGCGFSPSIHNDLGYLVCDNAETVFSTSDVVIDFTVPQYASVHALLAQKHKTNLVMGTTDLSQEDFDVLHNVSQDTVIVYSSIMSIAMNLLIYFSEFSSSRLVDDWDIEINEQRSRYEVKFPTFETMSIAKSAANGRGKAYDNVVECARYGNIGIREEGKIGVSSVQGGEMLCDKYALMFLGQSERVDITHTTTKSCLAAARGALHAAAWSSSIFPSQVYSMRDVMGFT